MELSFREGKGASRQDRAGAGLLGTSGYERFLIIFFAILSGMSLCRAIVEFALSANSLDVFGFTKNVSFLRAGTGIFVNIMISAMPDKNGSCLCDD
jgi:hypothetical protein